MTETKPAHVRSVGGASCWTGTPVTVQQSYYSTATQSTQPRWVQTKAWADSYWTQTRTLLVWLGFSDPTPAPLALDIAGVDVIAGGHRLAWRCRAARFLHHADVTLRYTLASGVPTEVDKLRRGSVDYLLWTWAADDVISAWLLLDARKVAGLLSRPWPLTVVGDVTFCSIPFLDLSRADAIVRCSAAIRATL